MDLKKITEKLAENETRNIMISNIVTGIAFSFITIMVLSQIGKIINSLF